MSVAAPEANPFWPREREVLRPPEKLTVSEWISRVRYLDERTSGSPGIIDLDYTPWVKELLDSFGDPKVRRITIVTSRQVAKTTTLQSMIAWAMVQEPGPAQLTLHGEQEAKDQLRGVRDMILASPKLRKQVAKKPRALTDKKLEMLRMTLRTGWATSTAKLKGNPLRYLFNDEVEAWPEHDEGHSRGILAPSTNTFWNSKAVDLTTPLFSNMLCWRAYDERSDRCEFQVPCLECGTYQTLEFGEQTVRFPSDEDPELIEEHDLATLHCVECEAQFLDGASKGMFLSRGVWVPKGCWVEKDGELAGDPERPRSHRGFRINALYAPWVTYSKMAAEFLRSKDTNLREFKNLWEGLPYEAQDVKVETEQLAALEEPYNFGELPAGVRGLVAGIDVQGDGAYFLVWGFGDGGAAWLVDAGYLNDDVEQYGLEKVLDYLEDKRYSDRLLRVEFGLVDSGHRAAFVYEECRQRFGRFWPCKGWDRRERMFTMGEKDGVIRLVHVSTDDVKLLLTGKITEPNAGAPLRIPHDLPASIRGHLTSEIRTLKGARGEKSEWVRRPGYTGRNDWLDCAVYGWVASMVRSFQWYQPRVSSDSIQTKERPARPNRTADPARERRRRRRESRGRGGYIGGNRWDR